jgi:hypothetical protein
LRVAVKNLSSRLEHWFPRRSLLIVPERCIIGGGLSTLFLVAERCRCMLLVIVLLVQEPSAAVQFYALGL